MQPLRHSYTNDTRGDGRVVVKRYQGPDAQARRDRERLMLSRLDGLVPVPALLDVDISGELHMGFAAGVHGQELIEAGLVGPVLRACGHTLRRLHALDLARVLPAGPHPTDAVLVHNACTTFRMSRRWTSSSTRTGGARPGSGGGPRCWPSANACWTCAVD